MGRKKKVVEESDVKVFEYGELAIKCKCGRTQRLKNAPVISGKEGLQWVLSPREDSFIKLICDECGSELTLCFIEGVKPAEPVKQEDSKVDESIQEEDKQEEIL